MSVISVVDPYWLLEANLVFGPDEVTPEEVWARTSSIPGIQLKLGKIRAAFGKHGQLHTHAFPFVQAPVIMANTIGEEGFKDAGVEASWLTPLPWYSEVIAGAFQAEPLDDENPLDLGSSAHGNVPYLGRLKNVFDVSDETTMEVGASLLRGQGEDGHPHAAYGADLTFRNVPLRNSNRRGWIAQAEYLEKGTYVARQVPPGTARRLRVLPVPVGPGLVDRDPGRAGEGQLLRRAGGRRRGSGRRQDQPGVGQRGLDAFGVLLRSARVQLRPGRRRGVQAPRPAVDGADELHHRLPPRPCVLRRG